MGGCAQRVKAEEAGTCGCAEGRVVALFVKARKGGSMAARDAVTLVAQRGVEGDAGCCEHSPRQLLLVTVEGAAALGRACPPGALRENVRLSLPRGALESGAVVRLGTDVRLRVSFACEPCSAGARAWALCAGEDECAGERLAALRVAGRGTLATVLCGGRRGAGEEKRNRPHIN